MTLHPYATDPGEITSGPKSVCSWPLLPISVNFDRHVSSSVLPEAWPVISDRSGLQNAIEKRWVICRWLLVCQFLAAWQRQM
jgi:hypothetical protein